LESVKDEVPPIDEIDVPPITDLVVLAPAEHANVLGMLPSPLTHPVSCIKKVNVPARKQKFDAYCKTLSDKTLKKSYHGIIICSHEP
jgi:hypothetical protein